MSRARTPPAQRTRRHRREKPPARRRRRSKENEQTPPIVHVTQRSQKKATKLSGLPGEREGLSAKLRTRQRRADHVPG